MPYPVPPPAPPPVVDIHVPEDSTYSSSIPASNPATDSIPSVASSAVGDRPPVEKFPPEVSPDPQLQSVGAVNGSDSSREKAESDVEDRPPASPEREAVDHPPVAANADGSDAPLVADPAAGTAASRAELLGTSIEVGLTTPSALPVSSAYGINAPPISFGVATLTADLQPPVSPQSIAIAPHSGQSVVIPPAFAFPAPVLNSLVDQTQDYSAVNPASASIPPDLSNLAELDHLVAAERRYSIATAETDVEERGDRRLTVSSHPSPLAQTTSTPPITFGIAALTPEFQRAAIPPLSLQTVALPRALAVQLPLLDRLIDQARVSSSMAPSRIAQSSTDSSNNSSVEPQRILVEPLNSIPSDLSDPLPDAGSYPIPADQLDLSEPLPGDGSYPIPTDQLDLSEPLPGDGSYPIPTDQLDLSDPLPDDGSYPIPADLPDLSEPLPEGESYPIPVELPGQLFEPSTPIPTEQLPSSPGQILVIPEPGSLPPTPTPSETPTPDTPTSPSTTTNVPVTPDDVVELRADHQEYDTLRRIITAEGNAVMQFRQGVLAGDRLQVNLPNRTAVAEGNAVLTRGDQVLRGERFTYNFTQEQGTIFNARGEVFLPSSQNDFSPTLPTDVSAGTSSTVPLTDQIIAEQPVTAITSEGGLTFNVGEGTSSPTTGAGGPGTTGSVRRIRFEAEQIEFTGENWVATNVRLTNDPFSPPELELRSRRVTFTRLSPTASEIRARNPHVVIDQGFRFPFPRDRIVIDQRDQNPGLIQFGYDEGDRGGLFIESTFNLIATPLVRFTVIPQLLVQRAIEDNNGDFLDLTSYGLITNLDITPDPYTTIEGRAVFTSLSPDDWDTDLRTSLRVRRLIFRNYRLTAEYSYRDRLFNGSLGFQNVQRSVGLLLTSPIIPLGDTGISLSYQVGAQYINANTDRLDLLPAIRQNNRVDLGRFQVSVALNRGFFLWMGQALPRTRDQGMRYTPNPVLPYIQLFTGARGVLSYYTSDDTQLALTGTIGLRGQFGHFSRDFLDYTGFNISYSQTVQDGDSPFLFDRSVDRQVLSGGIIQQLVGPIRIGFQSSLNLDTGKEIDTNFIIEYSRRTFAITLQYNPVREIGLLSFRLNDFNWSGTPEPFSGLDDGTVEGGVRRGNN